MKESLKRVYAEYDQTLKQLRQQNEDLENQLE